MYISYHSGKLLHHTHVSPSDTIWSFNCKLHREYLRRASERENLQREGEPPERENLQRGRTSREKEPPERKNLQRERTSRGRGYYSSSR
jgi:hypothetical protein